MIGVHVKFLVVGILAAILSFGGALGVDKTTVYKTTNDANTIVIPDWKLNLVAGNSQDWWTRFGLTSIADGVKHAIWGDGLPVITGSPAQDGQNCPIIKLPDSVTIAAKRNGWTALHGEWSTANGVKLASWTQNYLAMGFSRDVKKIGIHYRMTSTGEVAFRTKYFTDKELVSLFKWKASSQEEGHSIAILDCIGTLMYVVKETTKIPRMVQLFARDGTLIAKSFVGEPVLRLQFADPINNYLIGSAEAPGINASIPSKKIPKEKEFGGVIPFGLFFQTGGYTNSSALMEPEYRWVITAGVQALAIYNAEAPEINWTIITAVEMILIALISASVIVVVGLLYSIFRMVYPFGEMIDRNGRIVDNPFLLVPERPPKKDAFTDASESRRYAEKLGLHGRAPMYGYGAEK